ncbi:hypothetical protein D9C73_015157 [Collichthys lucidus]|uniref:Uncharacterized protein n=1 Tax=Collichthys lucidus TaxID=240159 RepID=A0A4U5V0A4_COLLU|nr:hypothetical protein D9C73_015157 [Collichthys lucidus]
MRIGTEPYWPVALGRWTVHGEKASINQRDRHPLQHYSYHHNDISKNHCTHTDTHTHVSGSSLCRFISSTPEPPTPNLRVADILWMTHNYHIKSPFCIFRSKPSPLGIRGTDAARLFCPEYFRRDYITVHQQELIIHRVSRSQPPL